MYTTGISQNLLGLPLFSGIGFRTIALAVFFVILMVYIIIYAKRIRANPASSVISSQYREQQSMAKPETEDAAGFTWRKKIALLGLAVVFVLQAVGAMQWKWAFPHISALYLIYAALLIPVLGMKPSQTCQDFAVGASRLLPAALAIGIARSVMVLMTQAKIIDTAINALATLLKGGSQYSILFGIFIAVTFFNFFVISGSGKAMVLMPILGPLGQLVGINQQIMVLAFNYGDGFTNYIYPTSGALMAGLQMCDVEWQDWAKFSTLLFVLLSLAGFAMIVVAEAINLGPF
jgi:uncharacterized ion transporter superfamily protein YfcC